MYRSNIEITLFHVLFCILTIVTITTIINYYNHSNNQFSTFYILAQSDSNEDNKEGNEIDKKDKKKEEKKEKEDKEDKKKKTAEINKQEKEKEDEDVDSWTKVDQDLITKYNYRNLAIPKVYQTAPDGSRYQLKHDNPNGKVQLDETENENVFTKQNRDGSWRIEYGKPRIDINTKDAGILPDKVDQLNNLSEGKIQSWNFSELKDIGYWYKPSDWKNVEVTLIFKLVDSSRSKGEQHSISIVTRSISHSQLDSEYKKSDDEPKYFCGGSSYHNNISNDGNIRMKKEQYHIDYEWERYNETLTVGNIYDKIVGFKGIVYNINNTAVKLESWIDVENGGKGPYKKVHELIDNGDWGDAMTECDATTNGQAITWGSPIVIIKANDFLFDMYDMEIREIIPPTRYT
jgi:membrane-associated HD superfamily phosphohydrolase